MKSVPADSPLQAVSALADGQLRGDDFARAMQLLEQSSEARAAWHSYHVLGEALRAELPAATATSDFVATLRTRLQAEPGAQSVHTANATELIAARAYSTPASSHFDTQKPAANTAPGTANNPRPAANDGFWKLAAGFASVVAVGAVVWSLAGNRLSESGAQLAANQARATNAVSANDTKNGLVLVATEQGIVVRDAQQQARMQALLAAHKEFGGASALQMPAGFLRNATFELPQH
jgi:sigma-E factor negative regulatory protein RseA